MIAGYNFVIHTTQTYQKLINFFKEGGIDIFKDERFLTISSVDQFLIQTGKRLFKGFEDISEVHKLTFDLETTSLTPEDGRIFNIGIKDNRGFEHILDIEGETEEEKDQSEIKMIKDFFKVIDHLKPALICGYNSENFDWSFIFGRCEKLNVKIKDIAITRNEKSKIKRRRQTLKLAAEMEWYDQTIMWGYNIMDTIHAVRRAMAINSSIKSAGLKYICQFNKIAKPNRVYIDGGMIAKVDADTENKYAFNDDNGEWYKITDYRPLEEGFKETTGKYIVSRSRS
jgi:DNA polymerase elongation subunit (family B)